MMGDKIGALNAAIRETIPAMRSAADENPNAEVLVRAIKFCTGAQWHVSQPTPVDQFAWTDLAPSGWTDMGKALSLAASELARLPERGLPPVLVLISDGDPTDDFNAGLNDLMATPWGKKAVRIAIAVGQQTNIEVLQKFIGNPEIQPLQADSPEALIGHIKWASTAVLKAASSPASQLEGGSPAANVPIPAAPQPQMDANGVW
jgi:uncharacterized protein YegL